jgi:hypothetical protein
MTAIALAQARQMVRPPPKEVAAKLREISIRYGWVEVGRRVGSRWKVIAGCRRNAIEDLILHRYGALPDTDDRDLYLRFWAWHNLHSEHPGEDLHALGRRLGVELAVAEVDATVAFCYGKPRKFKATTLGRHLHQTEAERAFLGITAIVPYDITPAERVRIRKAKKEQRRMQRRRARGMKPRGQYRAESLSRTEPWKAEGIHRRTWERRRTAAQKANAASVAPSNLSILLHGTTLAASSLAATQLATKQKVRRGSATRLRQTSPGVSNPVARDRFVRGRAASEGHAVLPRVLGP